MSMNQKILIIDDDRTFLQAIALALRDCGDVKTTQDPREVISHLSEYDVVICDYRMNFLDGHEVLAVAKQQKRTPPVILVTAYATKDVAIEAANLHAYAILEKPVDYMKIREVVLEALADSTPEQLPDGEDEFEICAGTRSARYGETEVKLTDTEFRLLSLFMAKRGKMLSREAIVAAVWGEYTVADNALDTHLGNLKKKLPPLKTLLKAVRGRGYIYG